MTIKRLTLGLTLVCLVGIAGVSVAAQQAQTAKPGAAPAKPGSTPAAPGAAQNRAPWWLDEAIKKELGLTPEQAKTLDQIFTSSKDEMAGYYEAMKREDKELQRLIDEVKVEQWVVLRQIEKVETQRSNLNKLRTMTLYRMHRVLTPEQRVKLEKIKDRERKGSTNRSLT